LQASRQPARALQAPSAATRAHSRLLSARSFVIVIVLTRCWKLPARIQERAADLSSADLSQALLEQSKCASVVALFY
jgi:hypothetical protein